MEDFDKLKAQKDALDALHNTELMAAERAKEKADQQSKVLARKERKRRFSSGEWAKDKAMDCVLSLSTAVQDAGGAVVPGLLDMTLRDFINCMAGQNNIRFVHVPQCRDCDTKPAEKDSRLCVECQAEPPIVGWSSEEDGE